MILKGSGIWLQDLHRVEGNRNSTLGGHKEQLVCTRTQSKEVTLQETEPDLPVSVKGSPAELWVSRDRGTGGSRPGSCHLTWVLLEVAIKPTIEPVESRTRSFQAKQPTRREHSHTHQQTIRFKFYWTQPCPPEQEPVFQTTSLSHQQAYTSFFATSTRSQTEEAWRTTILQPLEWKPHQGNLIKMERQRIMSQMKRQD